jgi:2-oxoisovalerate dehydrogenase E1 component alpha subunit
LAVYAAVQEARKRSLSDGRGVLVEAMTYRVGHHSTSDDSFAYRGRQEVEDRKRIDNPILRFKSFLEWKGWWSEQDEEELKQRLKTEVLTEFRRADSLKKGPLDNLFRDVYGGEEPWNIVSDFYQASLATLANSFHRRSNGRSYQD